VIFPLDYVVTAALEPEASTRISDGSDIQKHEYIVDVGPRTLVMWADAIRGAKRALWNGPMGITEIDPFGAGSRGLARFLGFVSSGTKTIAGGGDTIPVLVQAGVMNQLSFVSTGGGAMLDFLVQGKALPGLKPLLLP
jgi:phosphoglycerate kinase